jgi:hypothetical protein
MAGVPHAPASPARSLVTLGLTVGLVLLGAGPAGAHVEATADPGAQAGAGPVTVAFEAAAESPSAGIAGVKAQLPGGLPPASVSLAAGPAGWALTPTPDGYEVAGAALPPGTDAEFTITIAQLPADRTEFPFPTLVRYTDGTEDAWIEVPTPENPEPANPAPVITVAAAPATTSVAPTSTPAPSSTPASSAPATPTTEPRAQSVEDDGTPAWLIVLGVLAVAGLLAGGAVYLRRSRAGG